LNHYALTIDDYHNVANNYRFIQVWLIIIQANYKFTGIPVFTRTRTTVPRTRTRPVPVKLLPVPVPAGTGIPAQRRHDRSVTKTRQQSIPHCITLHLLYQY